MSRLTWFAGGKERRQEALELVEHLEKDLRGQDGFDHLEALLASYQQELEQTRTSLPYVLSRLAVEVSALLTREQLTLSPYQKDCLDQLRQLSYIRYGY